MNVFAYFGLAFLLILSYFTYTTVRAWYRLRHIPGPPGAGWSKWWLFKHTWDGTMYIESAEQCFKYGACNMMLAVMLAVLWTDQYFIAGSLVRIGPNDVVTCDPEILKAMGAPRSLYRRSDWYSALRVDRENILSEKNEERHAMLRNKMAAGVCSRRRRLRSS
jgi:hypothetical protein